MKKNPERKGMRMKENRKLLKEVLKDIQHDMTDEEVLNLLADSKISESPTAEKYTLGQRAADAIAKFAGSWAFIFAFTGVLILWMVINTILAAKAFDPYPFILLNLVLSCVAAIQAPLIMMSQNRQEEKDRRRAENDYKVNLKTEIMIEDLHDKVNAILAKQSALEKKLLEQEEKQPKPQGIYPEEQWEAIVEAVLFTMGQSVELKQLAVAIDQDEKTTKQVVESLKSRYEREKRGMQIIELESSYQMCTRAEYYENLIRVASTPKKQVLTEVVLETLSIIAYKQPVTKMEIEKIRGVKSDHAVNRLVEYNLVYEVGRLDAPGRPALFATTEEFLRRFGVGSTEDLPTLNPEAEEEIKSEVEEELQLRMEEFGGAADVTEGDEAAAAEEENGEAVAGEKNDEAATDEEYGEAAATAEEAAAGMAENQPEDSPSGETGLTV